MDRNLVACTVNSTSNNLSQQQLSSYIMSGEFPPAKRRSVMAAGDDNADGATNEGKLLVMRYKSCDHVHNASTALANALQEPVSMTTMLPRFGSVAARDRVAASRTLDIRTPNLKDILSLLKDCTGTSDFQYKFMRGVESEADQFLNMRPEVFFINCFATMGIDGKGNAKLSTKLFFPVVLKRDHYYIIIGEEGTPVYRVRNPRQLFFTFEGTVALKYILSKNYHGEEKRLDFNQDEKGNIEAYCLLNVPPSNKWDDCSDSLIEKFCPYPVVTEPVVPPPNKSSLQIINLDDDANIVDFEFEATDYSNIRIDIS